MKSTSKTRAGAKTLTTKLKKEILAFAWEIFISRYPCKEDSLEALLSCSRCKNCKSENISRAYGCRKGKCLDCREVSWFLSDTFFDRIKEFQAWHGAIWLMQNGFVFTAKDLEELTGVAYSTAHEIEAKLSLFLYLQMKEEANTIEAPSAAFETLFLRRSLETPAKAHPIAEEEEMEKQNQGSTSDSAPDKENNTDESQRKSDDCADQSSPDEIYGPAKTVWNVLSSTPMHFDAIALNTGIPTANLASLLIMMELKGWIEQKNCDWYSQASVASAAPLKQSFSAITSEGDVSPNFQSSGKDLIIEDRTSNSSYQIHRAVSEGIKFLRQTFQGISRKYLQTYLGRYWCFSDHLRWGPQSLLEACRSFRAISRSELLSFVTPGTVKFIHTEIDGGTRRII